MSTAATTLLLLLAVIAGKAEGDPLMNTTINVLNKLAEINPMVRPSVSNDPTIVKVNTMIRDLKVDDFDMKATLDITFRMSWNDYRLTYRDRYVSYVTVKDTKLAWLPDLFFKSAMVTQSESGFPENYLRVFPNGDILYSTRLKVNMECPMNLKRFPHDVQQCRLKIGTYGLSTSDQVLLWAEGDPVQIATYTSDQNFFLEKVETDYCNVRTNTGEYSCLSVEFTVRRKDSTAILWYLRIITLIVIAWSSFFVPNEQFLGRLLLSLIPLLCLASYIDTINSRLATVNYTRGFDVFAGISFTAIFAIFVHNIVVSCLQGSKSCEDAEMNDGREASVFIRLLHKAKKPRVVTRFLLVGMYIVFLIYYFSTYLDSGPGFISVVNA